MNEPYMGQVFMFGFNFNPKYYQLCYGQLLAINQNQALFSLLGTSFGGNGIQTFALPDLRGRAHVATGQGPGLSNYVLGEPLGQQQVTLLQNNLPQHNHSLNVNNGAATSGVPGSGVVLSQGPQTSGAALPMYAPSGGSLTVMAPNALANAGGNLPVPVLQPYLAINYSISTQGIYPSRN